MKRLSRLWPSILGLLSLVLAGTEAVAQPNATSSAAPVATNESAPASVPQPTPSAQTTGAIVPPAPAPGSCRLGEHAGINETDAQTAASIVCRELPAEARTSGISYRIDLDKLGSAMFVALTSESNGQSIDSRRARLAAIEDVPTVAPHLVDALLHKKTMSETEQVGNLTSADAGAPIRRAGQFQVGVGVLGAVAPGLATVSPGAQLTLRYDTPRWVLTSQFRFAVDTGGEKRFNMTQLGVGPRYMLSLSDTSLFLGGGMVVEGFSKSEGPKNVTLTDLGGTVRTSTNDRDKKSGIGFYAEVGVEMMRLHKNRLNAAIRVDFPTFAVGGDYLVPISLTTSFVFD